MKKLKVNDRVRRVPYTITIATDNSAGEPYIDGQSQTAAVSTRGCAGTVKALREETTNTNNEAKERSLMVEVLWDNGTLSFHGPAGLELDS